MKDKVIESISSYINKQKTILFVLVGAIGGYYNLIADIEEAKKLPKPAVTRTEFDLKDELIRETINNNNKRIEALEEKTDKINDKVYNLKIK